LGIRAESQMALCFLKSARWMARGLMLFFETRRHGEHRGGSRGEEEGGEGWGEWRVGRGSGLFAEKLFEGFDQEWFDGRIDAAGGRECFVTTLSVRDFCSNVARSVIPIRGHHDV